MNDYLSLDECLNLIEEPNQACCRRILEDNREIFASAPGSSTKHQSWPGGYLDHVRETINVGAVLHESLGALRPLPFSLGDVALTLWLHDVEKPFKYAGRVKLQSADGGKDCKTIKVFQRELIAQYGIELTTEHVNALDYVEGELHDYHPTIRRQQPLAAFIHMCDIWSARGWFNHPLADHDSWSGAKRS